ncbi:MAG TPA: DUF3833 domain-containing protein [Rhodospirillales bacterium]|nr:DUF3833 domain-containing protein [Rhodospirillales bacterium]
MRRTAAALSIIALVTGCGSMQPQNFADNQPRLVIEEYFAGETRAWGIFEDRFGDLRRQFVVDITGTWDGRELVLDEDFRYSDGETEERIWRITKLDDHRYEGRAADVVGTATGVSYGNALNWRYDLDLKVGDGTWRVHFDDWMFLQPDGVLINRARVRKWGFEIGEVTIVFSKPDGKHDASTAAPERIESGVASIAKARELRADHPF